MAKVCKQHHLLLGLGARQQRVSKENLKLSSFSCIQRQRSSSWFKISAAAGSLPQDDASSRNTKQAPPLFRRRGEIPPEWEELSTPVPEPPNYLLLAAGFTLVYLTRQAILEELVQWASILVVMALASVGFIQRLALLFLVKALQLVKVPVAWVLTLAGWFSIFARGVYTVIVNTTSIWPTTRALLLVTLVLSIAVVWRVINPTVFVLLLLLLTGYSLLVQKKDAVLAALPATALLVAISEPALKAAVLILYLATAIYNHWRAPKEEIETSANNKATVQPLLMVAAAIFLGLTAGSRFLNAWQILWLAKG
ncbi:hypothetical protein GOP47_0028182 [Adiantum capillus-veneris]|nr:hypothetical protein GOP47_0028182 [Adiantum capillus-veneris]